MIITGERVGLIRVGIIGGSGYVGGELLRILLSHPSVQVTTVVSRRYAGEFIFRVHPNLRNVSKLKFIPLEIAQISDNCDVVFIATPHGASLDFTPQLLSLGLKIIDTSADFRLKNPKDYLYWYGWGHKHSNLLKESVYGLPEIHRQEIRDAHLVACPGCMAVSAILALAPAVKAGIIESNRIVIDVKIGSSAAGAKPTIASHHPERFGGVRPYKQVGHRHTAEIEQELNAISDEQITVSLSPYAVNMVRGILSTVHVFLKKPLNIKDVWRIYRQFYKDEPFIRLVRDTKGLYQLPNPSILVGSNFCDIGFELDAHINRMVLLSAIDNIVKGAAGQAVQCLNIILNLDERTGLLNPGFHPV